MQIVKTGRFVADIRRFIIYDLASKNPYAADRYLSAIDHALCSTATFPLSRQEQPHLGKGIRRILINPYVILYTVQDDRLIALRFLHGHQDITHRSLGPSG